MRDGIAALGSITTCSVKRMRGAACPVPAPVCAGAGKAGSRASTVARQESRRVTQRMEVEAQENR